MKKITILSIAVASLFLISCGGGGWSSAEKDAYMDGCTSGGLVADSYCQCTLDYLESSFPDPEDMLVGGQDFVDAVESCSHHLY